MALIPPNPAVDLVEDDETVCTREHCFRCFDALFCALTGHRALEPKFPDEKYQLFVTWNTRSSRPGRPPRLRGCIGTFEAIPIREGLAEYALISAFQDHRFRKIEERELETLECGVSLLTDFEDGSSYLDWTIGVHGVRISFPHPALKHTFSATYLPQIAPEQGWDKIETIDSAIHKAGWTGRITEDIRRSVKLRRYQSRKYTVSWEEYVQWRTENGGAM
ncbi:alport syndrome [Fomitopsis serialis]|uniref:alport syndrome n=1 Tax=Fomitopsis serialis TaxID=139415 RepID=UPI002008C39A|nr:alport syndrome [Neoantrodia serialis]KAH9938585.1 alport syndrome [Neoantrodia serialis]